MVINYPPVASDVQCNQGISGGSAEITGQTQGEAENLAPLISSGALPLKLDPRAAPPSAPPSGPTRSTPA